MSFVNILIIVVFSFSALVCLLAVKVYSARKMKDEELGAAIISSPPFFSDFSGVSKTIVSAGGKTAVFLGKVYCALSVKIRFLIEKFRQHHLKISNSMNGRRAPKKNGCSGYWQELNECKNGSAEFTAGGEEKDNDKKTPA